MWALLSFILIVWGIWKLGKTAAQHPAQSMALAKWIRAMFRR